VKDLNSVLRDLNVYRNWGILRIRKAKWKAWVGGRVCRLLRLSSILWDHWTDVDAILYRRGPPFTLTCGCYSVGIGSVIYSKLRPNSVGVADVLLALQIISDDKVLCHNILVPREKGLFLNRHKIHANEFLAHINSILFASIQAILQNTLYL